VDGSKRARERGRYRESRYRAAERQRGRETEKRRVAGGWGWGRGTDGEKNKFKKQIFANQKKKKTGRFGSLIGIATKVGSQGVPNVAALRGADNAHRIALALRKKVLIFQCVAVFCSVLQCVAVLHYAGLQRAPRCLCAVQKVVCGLQCVAVCCSVLQCVAMRDSVSQYAEVCFTLSFQ